MSNTQDNIKKMDELIEKMEILSKLPEKKKVKKSEEMDKSEPMYHIHEKGQRITSEPLSVKEINTLHGGVKKLESSGYRVVPHTEPVKKSVDVYSLNEELSKVIKPIKLTPPSAHMKEYSKPSDTVKSPSEAQAHTLKYSGSKVSNVPPTTPKPINPTPTNKPTVKPTAQIHAKMQQAKIKSGKSSFGNPNAMKEKQKMNKSEVMMKVSGEELTKSLRKSHSDDQITVMMKAACDAGRIHRNVFLEWQNYKTVNISVLDLLDNVE